MERIVIVGASLAGLRAAQAVEASGFEGEIVVVGDESHAPYARPPLSKELLVGAQTISECALPLRSQAIQWRLGVAAAGLDRRRKSLRLADGESLAYDRLILATGVRARQWPGRGAGLRGVRTLRTLEDASALAAELSPGRRLVIVGAGFIGCEVAATARRLGVEVTMLTADPYPMVSLGSLLGRWCLRLHRAHGVDVRCGCEVVALRGEGRVRQVELGDGSLVTADAVLVAIGAVPNTDWLASAGLALDPGVVCDGTLTSYDDLDVLAAGDVASLPDPNRDGRHRRVEHWSVAAELGRLAGANALREPEERRRYDTPPYVWSDQYEAKIQVVGDPEAAERFEVLESAPNGSRFVVIGARGSRVVAAVAVNAAKRLNWYRRQLSRPPSIASVRDLVAGDSTWLGPPLELVA
jgi:NADPH-dependent 2,4-dienoyl-CoA reductase/sulfur reductase-like enzyme